MKKLVISLLLVFSMVFVAACGQSADNSKKPEEASKAPEKVYTLRISTVIGEGDPLYDGYVKFAAEVEKRTNGGMQVTVYPNAVLGQDEDVMEQALLGVDVAFNTDAGRLAVRVPDIGIILAPYLFDNTDEAQKVVTSDLFKKWQEELENKHGLTLLSLNNYVGGRHFITKKPIAKPEDLNGLKIRTPGAPVWQESIRAMGGTPVAMPWVETYSALQQGVVDGAEAQHPASYGLRLHEIGKHITKTGHILLMNGLVVGTKWFKELPEEYQQILVEEAIKAGEYTTQKVLATEREFEEKMTAEGATIHEIDVEPFKQSVDAAYEKLGFVELRNEIYKILGK
ncbi:MAG: TRAP transporter substrate-binding protein DctP [Bacillota bacterium]